MNHLQIEKKHLRINVTGVDTMMKSFIAFVSFLSFWGLCKSTNHDYSFVGGSFDFTTWRQSNDGFQCSRDNLYVIMCKYRWDIVTQELGECELDTLNAVQCAKGTNTVLFGLIGIEAITIGLLLFYIYKKPQIDAKERAEIVNWLTKMSKIQSNTNNNNTF